MTKKVYSPTDRWEDLPNKRVHPSTLIRMLMREASPFLRHDVLEPESTTRAVDGILALRGELRLKLAEVLDRAGILGQIEGELDLGRQEKLTDNFPPVEDVIDAVRRNVAGFKIDGSRIVENLIRARDDLTVELLARLGLIDISEFSRAGDIDVTDDRFNKDATLWDKLPLFFHQFVDNDLSLKVEELFAFMDENGRRKKAKASPKVLTRSARLLSLIRTANLTMKDSVREAAEYINHLRKAEVGEISQPYELRSDLSTKSLMELLEIFLCPQLPLIRRFDAFIIMNCAIAIFREKNSDRQKMGPETLNLMFTYFNLVVWPPRSGHSKVGLIGEKREGNSGPYNHLRAAGDNEVPEHHLSARLVDERFKEILEEGEGLVEPSIVTFDGRLKTPRRVWSKVMQYSERVRMAYAVIGGQKVDGMSEKDAQKIIEKQRERMEKVFVAESLDLKKKPMDPDVILDGLGIEMGLITKKPLAQFSDEEKVKFRKLCKSVACKVLTMLGVTESEIIDEIDSLWSSERNQHNPNRGNGFSDYKVIFTFRGQSVELQIKPFDTICAELSPGSSAHHASYEVRRAAPLRLLILPQEVGGEELFILGKDEGTPSGLGRAISMDAS